MNIYHLSSNTGTNGSNTGQSNKGSSSLYVTLIGVQEHILCHPHKSILCFLNSENVMMNYNCGGRHQHKYSSEALLADTSESLHFTVGKEVKERDS